MVWSHMAQHGEVKAIIWRDGEQRAEAFPGRDKTIGRILEECGRTCGPHYRAYRVVRVTVELETVGRRASFDGPAIVYDRL